MEQKRSKLALHPSQLLGLEKSKQLGSNICKAIVPHLVDSFSNIALLTPVVFRGYQHVPLYLTCMHQDD